MRMEVGDAIIRSKRGSRMGPMEMRVKLDRVRLGDDPGKNFLVIMKEGKIRESTPRRCWTSPVPGVKLSQLYF